MSELEHVRNLVKETNDALVAVTDQYHVEADGFFNFKFIQNETGETIAEYADIYRMMAYVEGFIRASA